MGAAQHSRFSPRSRRSTDWGFGPDMLSQSVTASVKLLGTTSVTLADPATIVRIRGLLHLTLTGFAGAGEGFAGAAGIALVNADAFAQGINSIPGPLSDSNWDSWMWHSFFDVRSITGTIADGANAAGIDQRVEIDSKAMRKWDPADIMVLMTEFVESGNATVKVNADSRILVKNG